VRPRAVFLVFILVAGVFLAWLPQEAHAASLLVPSQYSTIQAAINAAHLGDTISVSSGIYYEALVVNVSGITILGASRDTTVIDGQGLGTVVWINASSVAFSGFTVRNAGDTAWGVHVEAANGVNITDNLVSAVSNGDGVNLYRSNNTLVDSNVFSGNLYAVNVTASQFARVSNNLAVSSDTIGVQLEDSYACDVLDNVLENGQEGIDVLQSTGSDVARNLIRNMTNFGVDLEPDSPHTQSSLFPTNNTLAENTFQRNHIGVKIQNATGNVFYHNDFFASGLAHALPIPGTVTLNTWDNSSLGGPVGGNYWDNYAGSDMDHDGIGDTPYVIGQGNMDSHPLMTPFSSEPVLVRSVVPSPSVGAAPLAVSFSAVVAGSLLPFSYSWSFGDGTPRSSLGSPVHVFVRPGNYSVSLTVRDASGEADSGSAMVVVRPASPGWLSVWVLAGIFGGLVVAGLVVFWRKRGSSSRARVETQAKN